MKGRTHHLCKEFQQ